MGPARHAEPNAPDAARPTDHAGARAEPNRRPRRHPAPPAGTGASPSDEALLAGIAGGDEVAARRFVHRYERRVFGLALTVLGDRQAAEDAAQEAFARVWRHAAAFDVRRAGAATWVLAITRNVSIDAARLRRADALDPDALVRLVGPGTEPAPDDAAVAASEVARVRAALRTVPEEQRRALLLAAFGGRTAAEIAESEGIPLGTAKTRIRTALRRVRQQLDLEPGP